MRHWVLIYIFLVFIITWSVLSCSRREAVSIEGYKAYIQNPENGLSVTVQKDDFEFGLMFKPIEYVIAQEIQNEILTAEDWYSKKELLAGYQYYTFRIRSKNDNEFIRTGLSSEQEYYQRLEYMVSYAQQDLVLVEGRDTLPCVNYHFERNYGLSPNTNIVLAFESTEHSAKKERILVYDDKILGLGKVELKILAKSIKRIPQVII